MGTALLHLLPSLRKRCGIPGIVSSGGNVGIQRRRTLLSLFFSMLRYRCPFETLHVFNHETSRKRERWVALRTSQLSNVSSRTPTDGFVRTGIKGKEEAGHVDAWGPRRCLMAHEPRQVKASLLLVSFRGVICLIRAHGYEELNVSSLLLPLIDVAPHFRSFSVVLCG